MGQQSVHLLEVLKFCSSQDLLVFFCVYFVYLAIIVAVLAFFCHFSSKMRIRYRSSSPERYTLLGTPGTLWKMGGSLMSCKLLILRPL